MNTHTASVTFGDRTTTRIMIVLATAAALLAGACMPIGSNPASANVAAAVSDTVDEAPADVAVVHAPAGSTTADEPAATTSTTVPAPVAPAPAPAPVELPPTPDEPVAAVRVPDPRPGNLLADATADGLAADYEPRLLTPTREIAYGTDPAHRLDLYLPTVHDVPVIVYLHAGGWVTGGRESVPDLVLRFVERGYAVASVDYRLAPDHVFPAQLHDAKRAIRWLKAFGERTGLIDGDRMVVAGTSAGGHIASMVAATPGEFEPTGLTAEEAAVDSTVVGLFSAVGPTDLHTFYVPTHSEQTHPWRTDLPEMMLGCSPCGEDILAQASTVTHLGDHLPPAYFAYGEFDTELVHPISQGEVIADAWARHSGSWFEFVDGAGHNFDHTQVNQRAIEAFVDRTVR